MNLLIKLDNKGEHMLPLFMYPVLINQTDIIYLCIDCIYEPATA